MKAFATCLVVTLFAAYFALAQTATGADETKNAKWQPLFNGKDLTG